jgi:hypothetical protein
MLEFLGKHPVGQILLCLGVGVPLFFAVRWRYGDDPLFFGLSTPVMMAIVWVGYCGFQIIKYHAGGGKETDEE